MSPSEPTLVMTMRFPTAVPLVLRQDARFRSGWPVGGALTLCSHGLARGVQGASAAHHSAASRVLD